MNVLFLGVAHPELIRKLESQGDRVTRTEEKITPESPEVRSAEFLLSYRYRYKVAPEVLARFPKRAINLHISLLPWNRGADPNLWSFLEDTPKGVTIHAMSERIDEGNILCQREVVFKTEKTLRETYDRLIREMDGLLIENWSKLKSSNLPGKSQPQGGSSHRMQDRQSVEHLLVKGWDTPVNDLIGKALKRSPR